MRIRQQGGKEVEKRHQQGQKHSYKDVKPTGDNKETSHNITVTPAKGVVNNQRSGCGNKSSSSSNTKSGDLSTL